MTLFEKEFLLQCLAEFELILSDEAELQKAIQGYSQDKPEDSRYQTKNSIPDFDQWTADERKKFSAAIFEAGARVSISKGLEDPEKEKEISSAMKLWKAYELQLSLNTTPEKRLASVKGNCLPLRKELEQLTITEPKKIYTNNNLTFFGILAVGAVVATTATVAALVAKR